MSAKKEDSEMLNLSERKRGPFAKRTAIFEEKQAEELEKFEKAKINKSEEKVDEKAGEENPTIKLRDRRTLQKNSLIEFSNLQSPKKKTRAPRGQKSKIVPPKKITIIKKKPAIL